MSPIPALAPKESAAAQPIAPRAAAIAAIRAALRAGGVAALSCDVFDTLLLRNCTDPVGVFEQAYYRLPLAAHTPFQAALFVQHRMAAEARLCEAAVAAKAPREVSVAEIYREFPRRLFGVAEVATLVAAEFAAERDLCRANSEVVELLSEARRLGVPTGLISDTYWSDAELAELIRGCAPELEWDFLFASVSHGCGKRSGLFVEHLRRGGYSAAQALHLGDNFESDVRAAARLGIQGFHYPQAAPALADILMREDAAFRFACAPAAQRLRLDGGARTARRGVLGRMTLPDAAFACGARSVGAVMTAFDDFVAARQAEIGGCTVAFVARDGFLPREVWRARGRGDAPLIHVNRRTALLASIDDPQVLHDFFVDMDAVDLASLSGFLKLETPALRKYFRGFANGTVGGARLAADLPGLIPARTLAGLAARGRAQLITHLRREIPGFDDLRALLLVDLGYAGTVQKGLRRALDAAASPLRLHGVYLAGIDEALAEIAEPDSAVAMISGAVILPNARRGLLSNIAVFEQFCSMSLGSVQGYDAQGAALREADGRSAEQIRLCERVRAGALAYAAAVPPPSAPAPLAAAWATAALARLLLLPTDDELRLLGGLRHDVNLGSSRTAALADAESLRRTLASRPFGAAFRHNPAAMWAAGGATTLSPLLGAVHAATALDAFTPAGLNDMAVGARVVVVCDRRTNHSIPMTLQAARGAQGELRLRVPLRGSADGLLVAFPAASLPRAGRVEGIAFAAGDNSAVALTHKGERALPFEALSASAITLAGRCFAGDGVEGFLAVAVPPFAEAVGVLTLAISAADGERPFAASEFPDDDANTPGALRGARTNRAGADE